MTILEDPPVEAPPEEELPRLVEVMTDEEVALAKILMDPSGLDQAEFLWVDETKEDLCWRAYPFQWAWYRCKDGKQLDQCGRAVGKSEGIMARILAFPCLFPGQEMVLVAPEKKHIQSIAKRVESRIMASRFYTGLLKGGRNKGITHDPFDILWANGATLQSRLPQKTGLGLKGIHPVVLEVDEGQDISPAAYNELPEVVRWEVPGARWLIHGVSKGVRDTFYEYSMPQSDFTVHQFTAMHRPIWDDDMRASKVKEYGGSDQTPEYRRNVIGAHGEEADRLVNLHRLMLCTDDNPESAYNKDEYQFHKLSPEVVLDLVRAKRGAKANVETIEESNADQAAAIREILTFRQGHRRYDTIWVGMDVGLVSDPSEIIIAAEYTPTEGEIKQDIAREIAVPLEGQTRLKVIGRVQMRKLPMPLQVEVVLHIIDFYKPRAFSFDSTGIGLPLYQELQKRARAAKVALQDYTEEGRRPDMEADEAVAALTKIKGYNFSGKVIVDFNDQALEELNATKSSPTVSEMIEAAGIKQFMKDAGTDRIREVVDDQRIKFPNDDEITNSINGQTVSYGPDAIDAYGKRRYAYGGGKSHILDAVRVLLVGYFMEPIETLMKSETQQPVLDRFGV